MNTIKRKLLEFIGYVCPECGGKMIYMPPCSHGVGRTYCENRFNRKCHRGTIFHYGKSMSSISFPSLEKCQNCNNNLQIYICDGIQQTYCEHCNPGNHI